MSNESDLQMQVQAIIDGKLAGSEALEVLRAADLDLFAAKQAVQRKQFQLAAAETTILYGSWKGRPSDVALGKQISNSTVKLVR